MTGPATPASVDPFDLPEELGTGAVVWTAVDGLIASHLVRGVLRPANGPELGCDLIAVDEAYPAPVAPDDVRALTHQAWRHGEVRLGAYDGRLTLLVPGVRVDVALLLEAVARLARAVGAQPADFSVQIRLA